MKNGKRKKRAPNTIRKLTDNEVREIFAFKHDKIIHKTKGEFYQSIADEYGIAKTVVGVIQRLKRNGLENRNHRDDKTALLYWRKMMKKEITKEIGIAITTKIYKRIYKKNPLSVHFLDRYGSCSVFITPERIIIQMNDSILFKKENFERIIKREIQNAKDVNKQPEYYDMKGNFICPR